jgi:hypothetical protein
MDFLEQFLDLVAETLDVRHQELLEQVKVVLVLIPEEIVLVELEMAPLAAVEVLHLVHIREQLLVVLVEMVGNVPHFRHQQFRQKFQVQSGPLGLVQ